MEVDLSLLEPVLNRYEKGDGTALIHILQDLQTTYRYLPPQGLDVISEHLEIPLSKTYAAATFYKAFSLEPQGRTIVQLCTGTACHVRGAPLLEEELCRVIGVPMGATTKDLNYTLKSVNCVGACAMAPLVMIGDKYHGKAQAAELGKLLGADGSSPDGSSHTSDTEGSPDEA